MQVLQTLNVPPWIQPSAFSFTGVTLDSRERFFIDRGLPGVLPPIITIAIRIFSALAISMAGVFDLLRWAVVTLSIYEMAKVGLICHLQNLIAAIATPIFAIFALFGYCPNCTYKRGCGFGVDDIDNLAAATYRQDATHMEYLISRYPNSSTPSLKTYFSYGVLLELAASLPNNQQAIAVLINAGCNPNGVRNGTDSSLYDPDLKNGHDSTLYDAVSEMSLFRSPLFHAALVSCSENMDRLIAGGADPNQEMAIHSHSRSRTNLITTLFFSTGVYFPYPSTSTFYLINHVSYVFTRSMLLYPDFIEGERVNEQVLDRRVRSIGHLIAEHQAFYSGQELDEVELFYKRLEELSSLTDEVQLRELMDETRQNLKKPISLTLPGDLTSRENPYLNYILALIERKILIKCPTPGLLQNNDELFFRQLKQTIALFLSKKEIFEASLQEAEKKRKEMLIPYFNPDFPKGVVGVIARYWVPFSIPRP